MGRLQSIENALSEINETIFQELCDSFLVLRNENYRVFSRTGSMSGRQKTTKGTPDSFFQLESGKYLFIEHSTNITAGITKLEDDIKKCIDESKTGVSQSLIAEIVLCLNFNINTQETAGLQKLLADTAIRLTIFTLDSLAIELHLHHRDLANQYLNVPMDTGQVVSINTFILEYGRANGSIATPLDNTFVHREDEFKQLMDALSSSDFVILTGSSGVGKTKLSIEVVKGYLEKHPSFEAFCISYKSHSLLDDLSSYLDREKDYVLFIDDANRIDAFNQIIGFYKGNRTGQLKLLITVRDYALPEVSVLCRLYNPQTIVIQKLTDDQIVEIVTEKPFEVSSLHYESIKRIADGNPRLAIMAALLANEEKKIDALADVSELFENYYSTFVGDDGEFDNDMNMKCLGIIAFFFTVPYKDREVMAPILSNFDLEFDDFIESIDSLDSLELLEIQFDYAKIPEQNLSTYFFYKAFVKDELLQFETLLKAHFDLNQSRFKDTVIPANNTFGYARVMKKIRPALLSYWGDVSDNRARAYSFLSTFWYYLQDETLEFIFQEVSNLPNSTLREFEVTNEQKNFSSNPNDTIALISEFFRFPSRVKESVELAFECVRKSPEHLPELIDKLRSSFTFDRDDWSFNFERQTSLFNVLITGVEASDQLLSRAFFALSQTFLKFSFHQTKGGRNNLIHMYHLKLSDTPSIINFRKRIWKTIDSQFPSHNQMAFEVLKSYSTPSPDVVLDVMKSDVPEVVQIISNNLAVNNFDHCKYVHDQIGWIRRKELDHELFDDLKRKFTNDIFELFLIIDWNQIRDKQVFDYNNYREYERIKESQIRSSVKLESIDSVIEFYDNFFFLKSKAQKPWNYNNVLGIIIDETYLNKPDIADFLLQYIISNGNEIDFLPRSIFSSILKTENDIARIWKLISEGEFESRTGWVMSFFVCIPDSLIKLDYVKNILETVGEMEGQQSIDFSGLEKYLRVASNFFEEILRIIYERNEGGQTKFIVWGDLFATKMEDLGDDLDLIKKSYIQQRKLDDHFDLQFLGLKRIAQAEPGFIVEYVNSLYSEEEHRFGDDNEDLSFVWNFEDYDIIVESAIDIIVSKHVYYGILEHFANVFFRNLEKECEPKADEFLLNYLCYHSDSTDHVNAVVDVVRHSRNHLFEKGVLTYLTHNQDPETFSRIHWRDNGGVVHGDVIMGDIEAAEWKNILSVISKSDLGFKLIPIKKYVQGRINSALNSADWERQQRFLRRF